MDAQLHHPRYPRRRRPKPQPPVNVLFPCTASAVRSIMAEALLNQAGGDRVRGYSAGRHPSGVVHPFALSLLRDQRVPTLGLRSKSWDDFAVPGAPVMHFVITVCERAIGEDCPTWSGEPITARWDLPDPLARAEEIAQRDLFRRVFDTLVRDQLRARQAIRIPFDLLAMRTYHEQ